MLDLIDPLSSIHISLDMQWFTFEWWSLVLHRHLNDDPGKGRYLIHRFGQCQSDEIITYLLIVSTSCQEWWEVDFLVTRATLPQFLLRFKEASVCFDREMEDIDTELATRQKSDGNKMSDINYRMKKTLQVDKLRKYFTTLSNTNHQKSVIG